MDDRNDLWRNRQLTKDSIAIVKAIPWYFNGGKAVDIKGILPSETGSGTSPKLPDVKAKADKVKPHEKLLPEEERTIKMLTSGKAGGYTLDHLLKNHPGRNNYFRDN